MLTGDMFRRRRHHFDPHYPGDPCPGVARRLPVPSRGAVRVDPRLADLLRAGSLQHRWPRVERQRPGAVPLNELVNRA